MERRAQPISTEEEVQRLLKAQERAREREAEQTNPDNLANQGHQKTDQVADAAQSAVEHMRDATHSNIEGGRAGAHEAQHTAQSKVEQVKAKAQEAGSRIQEKSREAGDQAYHRADTAMTASGERLEEWSQQLREHVPVSGRTGEVAQQAANTLERSGQYLQRSSPDDVRMDVETMIRQHPVEALLAGAGVGFLFARMTRRR